MKSYKVVNKKRFGAFIAMIAIVILTGTFIGFSGNVFATSDKPELQTIALHQGQTLWGIADSLYRENTSDVCYAIARVNGYNNATQVMRALDADRDGVIILKLPRPITSGNITEWQ